jgi:hypothetical protein
MQTARRFGIMLSLIAGVIALISDVSHGESRTPTLPGYVIHFDFISNIKEGRDLVRIAARGGAKVINIVPPAHIWENQLALKMLDGILDEIRRKKLRFLITRIDGSYPPNSSGDRFHYLYSRILTESGTMPNEKPTPRYFRATAGKDGYDEWMEEETRFYARHFGKHPGLLGINLGPFSEPFSSQRGGFLEYMDETRRYEITQYTPYAEKLWHHWLSAHFGGIEAVNLEYGTFFRLWEEIPLPRSESDTNFGKPQLAYFDFARSLNDWFVGCYETCRRIWHEESGNTGVPFILQFSGFLAEKLVLGRYSLAAFDIPDWISRSDAIGISLYTNSGYAEYGHASVKAMVNVLAMAADLRKDVFVLEGGCEAPNVVLNPDELAFFESAGRKLNPRTYIYEFLKEKHDEEYLSNPGKPVTRRGQIQMPAYQALRQMFSRIEARPAVSNSPELYVLSDAPASRGNIRAGAINAALYDLASDVSIRFITPAFAAKIQADVPILRYDGSVTPADEELSRLMRSIPPVDSADRPTWRRAAIQQIRDSKTIRNQ